MSDSDCSLGFVVLGVKKAFSIGDCLDLCWTVGSQTYLCVNEGPRRIRHEVKKKMDTHGEQAPWRQHIVSTPDVLSGKPRIEGTRIPVALILGYLAAGKSYDEVIKEFPDLTRKDIAACLDYARDLAEYRVV